MNKRYTLKRPALVLALIVIILGFVFIGLDILDINEYFRLHWPIAVVNTIFIGAVGLLTIYLATRNYLRSGLLEILALGGGVVTLVFGITLYGWLTSTDLNTRITAYDGGVLLASIVFVTGAVMAARKPGASGRETRANRAVIIALYAVVLLLMAIITWLAYEGEITVFTETLAGYLAVRDIVQGIAAIFYVSAALIYLKRYRDSRADVYFWYSLGLILFTAGVLFITRGHLESRVAWLGRISQYAAFIYFLMAAIKNGIRNRNV